MAHEGVTDPLNCLCVWAGTGSCQWWLLVPPTSQPATPTRSRPRPPAAVAGRSRSSHTFTIPNRRAHGIPRGLSPLTMPVLRPILGGSFPLPFFDPSPHKGRLQPEGTLVPSPLSFLFFSFNFSFNISSNLLSNFFSSASSSSSLSRPLGPEPPCFVLPVDAQLVHFYYRP